MEKPDNVIRIPCSSIDRFFKYWFEFIKPIHGLTDREIEVIASFAKHRFELSKVIKDDAILDSVTMGESTRKKVGEECGINLEYLQVILGKLRKKKLIINGRINTGFLPKLVEERGNFTLMLFFDFDSDGSK